MAIQIPSTSQYTGKINTATIGKIKVRKKESNREIVPLDKAVKKDDAKILNPQNRKQSEYKRKPRIVNVNNSLSEPVKIIEKGLAQVTAITVIKTPNTAIIALLLFKTFFNSSLFSAPK